MNVIEKVIISIICVSAQVNAQLLETNKPVVIQLTPEQVRDTFANALSDDYIKILAKDFAARAEKRFIQEMRKQKKALTSQYNAALLRTPAKVIDYNMPRPTPSQSTTKPHNEDILSILESSEALKLIRTPSPDGDHLDSQSGELSGEKRDKIPIVKLTKINGVYFRRLLGRLGLL